MKIVIFVHGFGVMKDARGMFTDIAGALTEQGYKCVLIDLNAKDNDGNILLSPFSKQVQILTTAYEDNKGNETHIIAHSQGCVVTALANLPNIKKTIFLAPPTDNNAEKTISYFKKNPLTSIDLDGTSRLARRDGTFTLVPKEYWKEREPLDIASTYQTYITTHKTVVVKAAQDELVSNEEFASIFNDVEVTEIETNHDFADSGRGKLIAFCKKILI